MSEYFESGIARPSDNDRSRARAVTAAERPAVVARICRMVASGMLLKTAVKREGVRRETFWRWLDRDDDLMRRFERARIAQAHALAEQAISIADAPVKDHADAMRARTRVDVRKWFVAKLAPRIYGDRIQVEQEQTALVRHVIMLPRRDGPPPAIIGGRNSLAEVQAPDHIVYSSLPGLSDGS